MTEECCRCIYAERDSGSSTGWYCNWKREHVYPTECCYKFDSKF